MLFSPQGLIREEGAFSVPAHALAYGGEPLCKEVFGEMWQGFHHQMSTLALTPTDENVFFIGEAEPIEVEDGEYAIHVTEKGIAVTAKDSLGLIHGFFALLDRIRMADDEAGGTVIDCFTLRERPKMKNRMVHFCIFPETELWELERFIRFAGALRFSHIVLEFWGMLRYDVMGELAWKHAYSKEEIRPLITLAKTLGLSVIPMFNHWGHAAASRVMHGKHVTLNQNPALASYFSEDGWCWAVQKQKVRALLRSVREELCELCGEGEYFHIGCDEACSFEWTKAGMDTITDFINEVAAELRKNGRRAIIWGDMFLYREEYFDPQKRYAANAPSSEDAKYMRDRLDRNILIADWQYSVPNAPVESAKIFCDEGFDTLLCPWDGYHGKNADACIDTVDEYALFGVMHTTWHTLSTGFPYILHTAIECFGGSRIPLEKLHTTVAAFLRKVYFTRGDYERSGWSKTQIGDFYK